MRRRTLLAWTPGIVVCATGVRGGAVVEAVGWLAGRWVGPDGGGEAWTRVDAVLLGVGWTRGAEGAWGCEVMRIDGPERLRFMAWPSGQAHAVFPAVEHDRSHVVFADPEHDFPKVIRYAKRPGGIVARVEGDRPEDGQDFNYVGVPEVGAPALEAADRGLVAEAGATVWRGGARGAWVDGARAVAASVAAPDGALGFTLGRVAGGDYVAVWRRGEAGWRVEFAVFN